MLLVSICIPIYNRELLIQKALDSCLNQTYKNIEIVICDNASTDESKKVVMEYVKKDNRVKFFENHENIGALKNFKRTLELAKGNYALLLGSDDWISPDFVEGRIKGFEICPDAAFISGPMTTNRIYDDNTYEKGVDYRYQAMPLSKEYVYQNFYKKYIISYFCLFRRDEILNNFAMDFPNKKGWDIYKTGYGLDLINCLNILKNYNKIYYVDKGVYNFGSPTSRESENIISKKMNLEEPLIRTIDDYKFVTYLFNEYYKSLKLNKFSKDLVKYKFLQLCYEVIRNVKSIKSFSVVYSHIKNYINMINISIFETIGILLKLPFYTIFRVYKYYIRKKYGIENK